MYVKLLGFFFVLSIVCALVSGQQSIIETTPTLQNNVVAAGYVGLTLTAEFKTKAGECRWNFENLHSVVIFSPKEPCTVQSDISSCVKRTANNVSRIAATYKIAEPINTTLSITIGCKDGFVTSALNITVAGKERKLSNVHSNRIVTNC